MPKSTILTNKPLKIAFLLDDGLDKPGGVQQNILTLGAWLIKNGHSVKYLVGETIRTDIDGVIPMSKNLAVQFNGNSLSIPLLTSPRQMRQILEKEKFDIVHVQVPYSPLMSAQVIKHAAMNSTIIGTFHILPKNMLSSYSAKVLGFWLRSNLKYFDLHFSVSSPAAKFAEESFDIKSSILPNPVQISRFKSKRKINHKKSYTNITFLGRLVSRKGCMELLKAIKIVQKNLDASTKIKINICGDGNKRDELEFFVKNNNLENIVTFHGYVSEKQKIIQLQKADISVFPSLGGESFGIVLIEAMAAGSSVVLAANNPGYRYIFSDLKESLFDPTNVNEFAKILLKYINDYSKQYKLYKKQQKLVKKFDVSTVGSDLLRSYRHCIEIKKER